MGFTIDSANLKKLAEDYSEIRIPQYQRSYDWAERELKALWGDLDEHSRVGGTYFIGPLNAERLPAGNGIFLADGQQRITSLSILLAAARPKLSADLQKEVDRIIFKPPATPGSECRIRDQTPGGQELLDRTLRASVPFPTTDNLSRHERAFNFFFEKFASISHANACKLASIVMDHFTFARVIAHDEGSGIRMFERANTRGRPLTFTDNLKSLLIGSASTEDAAAVVSNWSKAVGYLQSVGKYDDQTFVQWLASEYHIDDSPLRKSQALDFSRQLVKRSNVVAISRNLASYSEALSRILQGKTPITNDDCGSLSNIRKFSKFSQLLRLLPAARTLDNSDFVRLAEAVENTVCVIAIAKTHPPDIERVIPRLLLVLRDIQKGNVPFNSILSELRDLRNVHSERFGRVLINGVYTDFHRTYLVALWDLMDQYVASHNVKGKRQPRRAIDLAGYSVEHILPQSREARSAAREYGEHANEDRQRFANLTPLENGLNYGTVPYSEKSKSYLDSSYHLTKSMALTANFGLKRYQDIRKKYLPVYKSWNHSQLERRAQVLYSLAARTLDFTSRKIRMDDPTPISLGDRGALPRVSSFVELGKALLAIQRGDVVELKARTTLTYLGVVEEQDNEDIITELGNQILETSPSERSESLKKLARESPYLQTWLDLEKDERLRRLAADIKVLLGKPAKNTVNQVRRCLDAWVQELYPGRD